MKVIRTIMKGKVQKNKKISVDQAVSEVLPNHPKNTGEQVKKALLKGVRLQGRQGSFYQLEAGYQGEEGEYKDSESKAKRKKAGKIVKPEDNETICTPEGLAERLNTTAFNVRKAVRSLKLKRTGKYWSWNKKEDAETIAKITAAIKKAAEKPVPKPKTSKAEVEVIGGEEGPIPEDLEEDIEEEEEE